MLMPVDQTSVDILKAKNKDLISQELNDSFQNIVDNFTRIFGQVWNNADGLTPQQVMDAFGPSAARLFLIAQTMQTAMNTLVPNSLPMEPPYQFTINQDGTVTIGAAIPQPQQSAFIPV